MLSRNSASSRAIPTTKLIEKIKAEPFVPEHWGANKRGMQAGVDLDEEGTRKASNFWLEARDKAVFIAEALSRMGVHKQLANRVLEPFMWHTAIITATEWRNFLHLRTHPDAQPEFRKLAILVEKALDSSTPVTLEPFDWHLPYIGPSEKAMMSLLTAASISAARCARVSYLTQDGIRDASRDIDLADKLLVNGHMSPFEHPAECLIVPAKWGNFIGWKQYRKLIPNEHDPKGPRDGNISD